MVSTRGLAMPPRGHVSVTVESCRWGRTTPDCARFVATARGRGDAIASAIRRGSTLRRRSRNPAARRRLNPGRMPSELLEGPLEGDDPDSAVSPAHTRDDGSPPPVGRARRYHDEPRSNPTDTNAPGRRVSSDYWRSVCQRVLQAPRIIPQCLRGPTAAPRPPFFPDRPRTAPCTDNPLGCAANGRRVNTSGTGCRRGATQVVATW